MAEGHHEVDYPQMDVNEAANGVCGVTLSSYQRSLVRVRPFEHGVAYAPRVENADTLHDLADDPRSCAEWRLAQHNPVSPPAEFQQRNV